MTTIYIVFAYSPYEGSNNLRAFTEQAAAEEFKAKCEEHHKRMPQYLDGSPEITDEQYEAWQREHDEWECSHPGGKAALYHEGFDIEVLDLVP